MKKGGKMSYNKSSKGMGGDSASKAKPSGKMKAGAQNAAGMVGSDAAQMQHAKATKTTGMK